MSRKEKTQNKKYEKKKYKFIFKIIFIITMLVITAVGIYKVDYEVNSMLGNEDKNIINTFINIFNEIS